MFPITVNLRTLHHRSQHSTYHRQPSRSSRQSHSRRLPSITQRTTSSLMPHSPYHCQMMPLSSNQMAPVHLLTPGLTKPSPKMMSSQRRIMPSQPTAMPDPMVSTCLSRDWELSSQQVSALMTDTVYMCVNYRLPGTPRRLSGWLQG